LTNDAWNTCNNTNPRETQERGEINANAAELNEGANIDQINATLLGKKKLILKTFKRYNRNF